MKTFNLVLRTYPFVLLRLLLTLGVVYPVYKSLFWSVILLRKLFHVNHIVFDLAFACIGAIAVYLFFIYVSRAILHLVQYAHVAAMTSLITEGRNLGIIGSFVVVLARIGSFTVWLLIDGILTTSFNKIVLWWSNFDKVPEVFRKGFFSKLVLRCMKSLVYNLAETTASYSFWKNEEKLGTAVGKSLVHMTKNWKDIIVTSVSVTLCLQLLSYILRVAVIVLIVKYLWGQPIINILAAYFLYKVLGYCLRVSLVDPMITASMLVGFHKKKLDDSLETPEVSQIVEVLERGVKGKANRKEVTEQVVASLGSLVPEGISDLASYIPSRFILKKKGEVSKPDEVL